MILEVCARLAEMLYNRATKGFQQYSFHADLVISLIGVPFTQSVADTRATFVFLCFQKSIKRFLNWKGSRSMLEEPILPTTSTSGESTSSREATEDFEAGVLAQLDSLYRTALRLTHNQQEAEDLVQETMLKAFRFTNTYQRGTNLRAWLFRILNTSAINRYRKQATHPTTTPLPEGEEFYLYNRIRDINGQELSTGAEEEVLSHYLDEDVYQALSDLPLNFRMPIILADIEGLSYKEIAQALNIPIGTVMSRISRARRHLQRSLWSYAKSRGYVSEESTTQKPNADPAEQTSN
jgi:RNA polymerase sigma-70 factor, ECF subfamily